MKRTAGFVEKASLQNLEHLQEMAALYAKDMIGLVRKPGWFPDKPKEPETGKIIPKQRMEKLPIGAP